MQNDERLRVLVSQLVDGWNEKIEYRVAVAECIEKRIERRWQPSLIDQLVDAQYRPPAMGGDGSGGGASANKPGSKTPGNLERPDEILYAIHCAAAEQAGVAGLCMSGARGARGARSLLGALRAHDWPDDLAGDALHALSRPVRQARLFLGYDSAMVAFANAVCECGGALMVARDLPSAVHCAGTPAAPACGTSYPWWRWPALAASLTLADTAAACAWIGRPREVLYRWAREGRVTRHGGSGRGDARWNLVELPQHIPGQPLPDPPQKIFAATS